MRSFENDAVAGLAAELVGETFRHIAPREVLRCREREPGRLQLRVVLVNTEEHIDAANVRENDEVVVVFVTVCASPVAPRVWQGCDVPTHVYLDRPLGDRVVIDASTGEEVEQFELLENEEAA